LDNVIGMSYKFDPGSMALSTTLAFRNDSAVRGVVVRLSVAAAMRRLGLIPPVGIERSQHGDVDAETSEHQFYSD
jgi:hypothetical protein